MQITGMADNDADDDMPITLLLTKEEPVNDEPTVQVING